MISNEKTYLFLLAFMIFSSASLYAIDDGFDIRTATTMTATTIPTQTVEAAENESIVLSCGRTEMPHNDVKWFFNDILVSDQSKRKSQIDGDLHINFVRRNDSGYYRCVRSQAGEHNHRTEISTIIKLETIWLTAAEVVYSSSSSSSSSTLDAHKSSAITLKCHVDGSPIEEIKWLKNGKPVPGLNSIDPLVIRHPTQNDNAVYKCVARNKIGTVISQPYRVEIHANAHNMVHYAVFCEPKITNENHIEQSLLCRYKRNGRVHRKRSASENGTQSLSTISKLKKINVAEEKSATINCDVNRLDRKTNQLSVKWKKDGKVIRQSVLGGIEHGSDSFSGNPLFRDDRIIMDTKNGSITIALAIPSDAGSYECSILRNGNAVQSVQITEVNIIEKLKFAPPPTSNKGLEIGSVGKIHCKVQGTPTPQIQWTKDSTNSLPETVEDINGTLVFKNVSESDRGNYTCRAVNSQGEISATVVVTPVIAPKFLVKPQGAIQVNEMGSVMIHCAATGDPKPKIQWDKDFDYLNISNSDTSRLNVLDNGTLYFTEVHLEDEGLYGCTIGSSAGLKREEAHLSVKPSEESIVDDGQEGSFFVVRAVLITVTVVFSYIILVIGLMFWCRVKRKARKNRMQLIAKENVDTLSRNDTKPNDPNDENEPCLAERNHKKTEKGWNGTSNGIHNHNNDASKTDGTNATKHSSKSNLDQITIPRTILFDVVQMGRGDFGNLYTAKVKFCDLKQHLHKDVVTNITVENEREQRKSNGSLENADEIKEISETTDETVNYALIKALNKVKDENVCIEFRRQLEMFRAVNHRNVVKLFGLCRDKDPHYLVLEHTDLGDLKEFLSARADQLSDITAKNGIIQKNHTDKTAITIKLPQLLSFAQQIARGMDAIYRARYMHRDLAARNCVITSDLAVKVSYPANIKDKYIREYYKLKNSMVPLRWMAPECIEDDDNTIKTDVYSFGVLVLELFTFCTEIPLESVPDDEYLKQLTSNQIERKIPDFVPEEISKSLLSCWKTNPKERPSFSTLNSMISKYIQQIDANPQAHA